jgi:hypothetical protein
MSCVSPEATLAPAAAENDAAVCPPSTLLAQLADGLHAMAQPLTILRGAIGALQLTETGGSREPRYVAMCAAQVTRLCDMLANLRSLLDAVQFAAICSIENWQNLIETALDSYEPTLEKSGARFRVIRPERFVPIVVDRGRTQEALRAALDIAQSFASPGDEIQCRILPNGLVLENECSQGKSVSSPARLALSLLETAILSQQAEYRFTNEPFCLSIAFPPAVTGITSDCLQTAV